MRGSIICLAIFCLSNASGAPTDEEGKTFFKSYKFDEGDVIHSQEVFVKDELVFAVCEGSGADKKCKVYVESTDQDKNTVQSCDLNVTYKGLFESSVALYNAGNSKAVFAVKDGDDKAKLINVNIKECLIKEAIFEFEKVNTSSFISFSTRSYIIPREKNYDVIFRNTKLCGSRLCKATYDYEGNVVKAASKIPAVFEHANEIEYVNNSYIIAKSQPGTVAIYLVKDGDDQPNIHPVISTESQTGFIASSAEENKISICSHGDGKVLCKQVHLEGEPRTINIEIPFGKGRRLRPYLKVLNLEKGLLQLSIVDKHFTTVTHFDEEGKQGKSVHIDPKCNSRYAVITKLYKNTSGQYCVNSFCVPSLIEDDRSEISRTNTCYLKTELI